MKSFHFGDLLFSLKTYVAALIALYIAFEWNLSQPYWALLTVLIVAQPYTGMVRSKALYRFVGTFVGASMAVFLVPRLVDIPGLLTVVLAAWISLCLYLSLIDGTPRSYAYILSGYTVALIGFPSVEHPEAIFNTALSRVEEVCLGILTTFLVNELFFPRSTVGLFFSKVGRWLDLMEKVVLDVLSRPPATKEFEQARHPLSIELASLAPLALFASYDTSAPDRLRGMNVLRFRMGQMLPLFSEVVRHLERTRREDPEGIRKLAPALEETASWIREVSRQSSRPLPVALTTRDREWEESASADPRLFGTINVFTRLREFCLLWGECQAIRKNIPGEIPEETFRHPPHRDYLLAALSAVGIFLTIVIAANFWILTEWPDGAVATMMAAVVSSFFSAMDDPAPAIFRFLGFITFGSAVGILFLYALLPMAHDFLSLSILLAVVLLPAGVFLGRPDTTIQVLAFSIGFGGLIALSSTYSANFTHSVNTAIAQSAGVLLAAGITRLIRSVGADFSVRRLYRADLRDLARIARPGVSGGRNFPIDSREGAQGALVRILERTAQLALRLQALTERERAHFSKGFLHVGLARNLIHLSRLEESLPPSEQSNLAHLRESLSEFFENKSRRKGPFPLAWKTDIARLRNSLLGHPRSAAGQEVLVLLTGLETLLPEAPGEGFSRLTREYSSTAPP